MGLGFNRKSLSYAFSNTDSPQFMVVQLAIFQVHAKEIMHSIENILRILNFDFFPELYSLLILGTSQSATQSQGETTDIITIVLDPNSLSAFHFHFNIQQLHETVNTLS